jgi:hypothetical protein
MQTRKPGKGSGTTGAHVAPGSAQTPLGFPTQTSAAVLHVPGEGGPAEATGATRGVHPVSLTSSGVRESDCTQGTPLQSFPAAMALAAVQAPVQAAGASNGVESPEQSG